MGCYKDSRHRNRRAHEPQKDQFIYKQTHSVPLLSWSALLDLKLPRRLDKFLADAGLGSKRHILQLVASGRVRVNGYATPAGRLVCPQYDRVEVDGERCLLKKPTIYAIVNKPKNYLTAMSDPKEQLCIASLMPKAWRHHVAPVGRLDKSTTGALLCTDDGDLNQLLTQPQFHVWKRYRLTVVGQVGFDDPRVEKLRQGVKLNGSQTLPARAWVIPDSVRQGEHVPLTDLYLEIREGRYRQIRKMASRVKMRLVELHREMIGPVELGLADPGKWRYLETWEVESLYEAAGGRNTPIRRAQKALLRRLNDDRLAESEKVLVKRYFAAIE